MTRGTGRSDPYHPPSRREEGGGVGGWEINTHKHTYAWTHTHGQMYYANTLRLTCATAEGQKHSETHSHTHTHRHTHTSRRPNTLKSFSSDKTHTWASTHMNEHTEDICINILSHLNSNANICAQHCDHCTDSFKSS